MKLIVSGERKTYGEGVTLPEVMEAEQVETPQYVTVTVNDEFVAQEDLAAQPLADGDTVEFIYFMGGGGGWAH